MAISDVLQPFMWGKSGQRLTPDQIASRERMARSLLGTAVDTSPTGGGWASILSKGVAGALSGYDMKHADAAATQNADESKRLSSAIAQALSGGAGFPSAVAAGASPTSGVATGTTPTTGETVDLSGDKQKFIDTLLPAAIEHGQRIGVDPRIIVAQAAQETGWGKSAPGNNFFGIKSHGQGGGQNLTTHEVIDGKRVKINDSFRTFASPQDSVAGYADFLTSNPRYRSMREAQGLDAQLQALGASGYATDPNYARSVGTIARSINVPAANSPQAAIQAISPVADPDGLFAPGADVSQADLDFARQATGPDVSSTNAPAVAPYDFTGNPQLSSAPATAFAPQGSNFDERWNAGAVQQPVMPSVDPTATASIPAQPDQRLIDMNDQMFGGALSPTGGSGVAQALAGYFPDAPSATRALISSGGNAAPSSSTGGINPAIIEALSSPYVDDSTKRIASMLLGQQMKQNDPTTALEMEYKRAQIDALRAKPATTPTSDIQNYEYARNKGYQGSFPDYQQSLKKAGSNSTVINNGTNSDKFVEKSDEAAAGRMNDYVAEGARAAQTMSDMQQLLDLGSQIGTGREADIKASLGPWAQMLGVNIDGLGEAQAFKSITDRLAPQMRPVGAGSSSDRDVSMYLNSLPSLRNTPEGNTIIANTMRGISQNKISAAEIAARAQSGEIKWQEAEKQIRALPNPYENFKKFMEQSGTGKQTSSGVKWSVEQ